MQKKFFEESTLYDFVQSKVYKTRRAENLKPLNFVKNQEVNDSFMNICKETNSSCSVSSKSSIESPEKLKINFLDLIYDEKR